MSPYHRTNLSSLAMASTMGGQRRILKHPHDSVIDYIRKAVHAGIYRTKEEIATIQKERKDGIEDLRIIMNRLRQDIIRGSHVQDYPTEYLILEQHPPIPDPPRIPKKYMKLQIQQKQKALQQHQQPLRSLTKKYLQQYEKEQQQSISRSRTDGSPLDSTEYYRRLLGVQQASSKMSGSRVTSGTNNNQQHLEHLLSSSSSTLYYKPAILQKAYTAAVLHHNLQQQQQRDDERKDPNSKSQSNYKNHFDNMIPRTTASTTSTVNDPNQYDPSNNITSIIGNRNIHTNASTNDIMKQVNELLSQQTIIEQTTVQQRTRTIQDNRHQLNTIVNEKKKKKTKHDDGISGSGSGSSSQPLAATTSADDDKDNISKDDDDSNDENTMDSIFYSDPNTIEGMIRWSQRLQTVPYKEWTIGASTALDHWVARQVLQLSEVTWQTTLEGYDTQSLAIGRDIVACRETLFPETALHPNDRQRRMMEQFEDDDDVPPIDDEDEEDKKQEDDEDRMLFGIDTQKAKSSSSDDKNNEPETRSIEDLLERLGGLRAPDAATAPGASTSRTDNAASSSGRTDIDDDIDTIKDMDAKVNQLVDELQNWRRRHYEVPYDQWDAMDQEKFSTWMKKYVRILSSDVEKRDLNNIDWEETRIALLSEPPISQAESSNFWNALSDEASVHQLLDRMIKDGPPSGTNILHASFWDLPRPIQVQQLLNIGAIRPLLDEYVNETDRLHFIQRYGDTILAGVPLEHLIPDPSGPIKASDLSRDIVTTLRIGDNERFRLEKLPFLGLHDSKSATTSPQQQQNQATYDAYAKSRFLFKIWNEHKAGRARYEEKLYQTGRLGLRYGDEHDEITPRSVKGKK